MVRGDQYSDESDSDWDTSMSQAVSVPAPVLPVQSALQRQQSAETTTQPAGNEFKRISIVCSKSLAWLLTIEEIEDEEEEEDDEEEEERPKTTSQYNEAVRANSDSSRRSIASATTKGPLTFIDRQSNNSPAVGIIKSTRTAGLVGYILC